LIKSLAVPRHTERSTLSISPHPIGAHWAVLLCCLLQCHRAFLADGDIPPNFLGYPMYVVPMNLVLPVIVHFISSFRDGNQQASRNELKSTRHNVPAWSKTLRNQEAPVKRLELVRYAALLLGFCHGSAMFRLHTLHSGFVEFSADWGT
jgi:hypothetical protein